jgi:hypothetical protein
MAGEPVLATRFARVQSEMAMNIFQLLFRVLLVAPLILSGACGKKIDVRSQANELEKSFEASQPNAYVNFAVSAVRTNDYAVSVIALQNARRVPGLTADQLMAVQQTLEAITADLVARAARGDAKAQADLAAIERSRSQ